MITEGDLLLAIAFNNIEPSLLTQFSKQISESSYDGKVKYALNDLFERPSKRNVHQVNGS
jgi:hypothetical protein